MRITISPDAEKLGRNAAREAAEIIRSAIQKDGCARIVLSTGASQFTTLEALVKAAEIDWRKVEMFHLDEYVGLSIDHKASFRKYLRERFVEKTNVGQAHFVDGTPGCIQELTKKLNAGPIHLGMIGIGQNAHIAFNDPPADFETEEAYIVVRLNETCKRQQVHEGWFATTKEVPCEAISMSVKQIMQCQRIISAVPYQEKADAVAATLHRSLTNEIPATMLKTHPAFSLYVDWDSFSKVELKKILPADSEYQLQVCTT